MFSDFDPDYVPEGRPEDLKSFNKALDLMLSDMVDKGLISMGWDAEKEEVVYFLTDNQHISRFVDMSPADLRDMYQTVNAAQINEYAVFGNILHRALHDGPFKNGGQRSLAFGFAFFIQNYPSG